MEIIRGSDIILLKELLGTGGFSKVYYSELIDGVPCAIKIINKNGKIKKSRMNQIVNEEIKIQSSVIHSNIVGVKGHFEDENNYYIILEYCNSKTLLDLYKKTNSFSVNEIRSIVLQIIDATMYLHSRYIIHGDLKLGNIFLHDILQVKIGDFGLATQLKNADSKITRFIGTPNYIAPEIINRKPYSFSCDIWAIGVILYALVYKELPFEYINLELTYQRIRDNFYIIPNTSKDKQMFIPIIRRIFDHNVNSRITLSELKAILLDEEIRESEIINS